MSTLATVGLLTSEREMPVEDSDKEKISYAGSTFMCGVTVLEAVQSLS